MFLNESCPKNSNLPFVILIQVCESEAGALVQDRRDKTCKELFGPCGEFYSNYEAEAAAIESALTEIENIFSNKQDQITDIVVFTDALSVLQALENDNSRDRQITNVSKLISKIITSHEIKVILQWIPGHTDIPGNDRADLLAKAGASKPQTETSASLTTAKQVIKQQKKKIWLNQWANSNKGLYFIIWPPLTLKMRSTNSKETSRLPFSG